MHANEGKFSIKLCIAPENISVIHMWSFIRFWKTWEIKFYLTIFWFIYFYICIQFTNFTNLFYNIFVRDSRLTLFVVILFMFIIDIFIFALRIIRGRDRNVYLHIWLKNSWVIIKYAFYYNSLAALALPVL